MSKKEVHLHWTYKDESKDRVFRQPLITIGRSSSCDIRIKSYSVSRKHVLIHNDSKGVRLENHSSRTKLQVRIKGQQRTLEPFHTIPVTETIAFYVRKIKFALAVVEVHKPENAVECANCHSVYDSKRYLHCPICGWDTAGALTFRG